MAQHALNMIRIHNKFLRRSKAKTPARVYNGVVFQSAAAAAAVIVPLIFCGILLKGQHSYRRMIVRFGHVRVTYISPRK